MARTAYDVNRAVRHLDIHKQFMGGLKTVDTDDALRTVYMRELKNLSLSEYGFIEKRYGIYKQELFEFVDSSGNAINPLATGDEFIQGYFEYYDKEKNLHKLIFIDGIPYIKDPRPGSAYPTKFRKVNFYGQEIDKEYPDPGEIQIGTGFVPVPDLSKTFVIESISQITFGTLIKDFSKFLHQLFVNSTVTFSAIKQEDVNGEYTVTASLNNTDFFKATDQPDEFGEYSVSVSPSISHDGILQLDILGNYSISSRANVNYGDLGILLVSKSYSLQTDSQISFNDTFTLNIAKNYNVSTSSNISYSGNSLLFELNNNEFSISNGVNIEYAGSDNCAQAGTYLGYYCSGTTRVNRYADGTCGTYTTSTPNSTTCGYEPPPPPKLNTPTYNASGTTVGETEITISYNNPNGVSATLDVYRNTSDYEGTSISENQPASVTYTGLTPDTTYNFRARLRKSGYTDSDFSPLLELKTDAAPPSGATTWTYLGEGFMSSDEFLNAHNDLGMPITSTCPTYITIQNNLPPAANYSLGTVVGVGSQGSVNGNTQICSNKYYRAD